jgi:molecular chaperone GrpE
MSKHSLHHEKHHKDSAKNRETVRGQEDTPDREAEAALGAAQNGPQDTAETVTENGEGPGEPAAGEAKNGLGNSGGPEGRIAELEAQAADYKDQLLRKTADFENFRKRMNREKLDAIDFANQSLLLDLIPILDDFDRAARSAENSKDFTALFEGVGMISKRLTGMLDNKWGLKSYVSAGTLFDPNFHEALMMEKSSAVSEQTVQMDLLKGYTLKNRVIRSAKVKVLDPDPAAPAVEAPPAPQNEGGPAEKETAPDSPEGEGAEGTQV